MQTQLVYLESIPEKEELTILLGEEFYKYYEEICEAILPAISPEMEIWSPGGRQGKYQHLYRLEKRSVTIQLYLVHTSFLKCAFSISKRLFDKIWKQKEHFTPPVQKTIDWCRESYKGYGIYLEIFINKETLPDTLRIIDLLAGKKENKNKSGN